MNLSLIARPSSEIVTLKEAKNYLRVDHDFDDELINTLIICTREAMESIIQKSIVKQTWSYTVDGDFLNNVESEGSIYSGILNDSIRIPLPKPPIMQIVSVSVNETKMDPQKYKVEKRHSQFCLLLSSDIIKRRRCSAYADTKIVIVFDAGISEDPKNVPYQLKLANLMLLSNAYNERYSYKAETVVNPGVRQLLSPFLNLRLS